MVALRTIAGRIGTKRALAAATTAIALGGLFLATEIPAGLLPAVGGSKALAELIARSPGARIGGAALKAKSPRSALAAPATTAASALAEGPPENAFASVLGVSAGPEGAVPAGGPIGPGGFPSDFAAPALPGAIGAGAGTPSSPSSPGDFGPVPGPPMGGLPIFIPGGPSGGGGGGPGGTNPGGGGIITPPIPPAIPGIPEPSTWLMLIAGFGGIGHAMRRRRRVAVA